MVGKKIAITIGYSVGLGPKDPNYEPNPWFSSFYILVGAALIANTDRYWWQSGRKFKYAHV